VGIRRGDYATSLYQQKLALTSPTSGGRSVGLVRSRTQATEFVFVCFHFFVYAILYRLPSIDVKVRDLWNHRVAVGGAFLWRWKSYKSSL
jgi:hypothetical protein